MSVCTFACLAKSSAAGAGGTVSELLTSLLSLSLSEFTSVCVCVCVYAESGVRKQ